MKRFGARVAYFVRTALHGLRSSPLPSTIAAVTIGVTLMLVGAFGLLLWNMEDLLKGFGDDLHVAAYLEDGLAASDQQELRSLIRSVEGVESVRLVS